MKTLDRYADLLLAHKPIMPRNEEEHEAAVELLESLVRKEGKRPDELQRLIELLTALVLAYEEKVSPIPMASGAEVLRSLLEEHGMRQAGLVPGLGSKAYVNQIVHGRRSISASTAEKLGRLFKLNPKVFLHETSQVEMPRTQVLKVLERERIRLGRALDIPFDLVDLERTFLLTRSDVEIVLMELHSAKEISLTRWHNPYKDFYSPEAWPSPNRFFTDPKGEPVIHIKCLTTSMSEFKQPKALTAGS